LLNVQIEEFDGDQKLDEDDGQEIDIITGARSIAEETYSLPVIMDNDEEELARPVSQDDTLE
jgi:hypothetical protein